jgi:hypothetical protein
MQARDIVEAPGAIHSNVHWQLDEPAAGVAHERFVFCDFAPRIAAPDQCVSQFTFPRTAQR